MSNLHAAFRKLSLVPFGRHIVSKVVTLNAPYFSTIRPLILDMGPGRCTIRMKDRRAVHNHIGTVNAIAMCNLCELTMGMALHPTMPAGLRWIPRGMKVRYLKKARGTLIGRCVFEPESIKEGDIDFLVTVSDASGDVVMDAVITVLISRQKAA